MQIALIIAGAILILASTITMWEITIWFMKPIKEIFESSTKFNIHILFRIIGRFIIAIITVIIIIFALLLGFQLINK